MPIASTSEQPTLSFHGHQRRNRDCILFAINAFKDEQKGRLLDRSILPSAPFVNWRYDVAG
jgi:hypothetical protein